ncbi:type IV secretion system protein VirB10, partial [uncultured Kingella sp.]|uniref:type IV secretion system protein VirB10 n=1 Tax=uncultured Kingella sp. TaxID=159270 RepID=UPI002598D72E
FMMMWVNRTPTEPPAEEKKPEVSNGRQYDFAAEQAKIKRELDAQQEAEVEASAPEGITPDVASTPSVAYVQAETVAASEPPPKDRRLLGEILVGNDGGTGSIGTESATNDAAAQAKLLAGNNSEGIPPISESEMSGLQSDDSNPASSGNRFAAQLNPTQTAGVRAMRRANSDYLLAKGTNIPCTLQTRIVTTQAGFTRCIVNKDVYSANGKVLLLERGSKITGEQTAALLQGQARIFALWNEVETPYGVRVNLASPSAGQLGEAGIGANVKYHFWQRFGGAIMISLIGDLGNYAGNRKNSNGNGQTFNFDNTSQSAQDMATEALKNSINIPPTGYVNQGSFINIIVARDVDFGGVYERVNPHLLTLDAGDAKIRQ